jgi:hypothetical protein
LYLFLSDCVVREVVVTTSLCADFSSAVLNAAQLAGPSKPNVAGLAGLVFPEG